MSSQNFCEDINNLHQVINNGKQHYNKLTFSSLNMHEIRKMNKKTD